MKKEMIMQIEVNDEMVDRLVLESISNTLRLMEADLKSYEDPNHGWIAIFDTNEEADKAKLREMKAALRLVVNYYGGKDVEAYEDYEDSTEDATSESIGSVSLIRENEDGSADYSVNLPLEAAAALTRLGILTALTAGVADAKRLKPTDAME